MALDPALAEVLVTLARDQHRVAARERRTIARLAAETDQPLVVIPEQDKDVHDLRGLAEVGAWLSRLPKREAARRARKATPRKKERKA